MAMLTRRRVSARATACCHGVTRAGVYAHLGEPWYGFVRIESLLNRAPLHVPFKGDGSYLLYNDDMVQ